MFLLLMARAGVPGTWWVLTDVGGGDLHGMSCVRRHVDHRRAVHDGLHPPRRSPARAMTRGATVVRQNAGRSTRPSGATSRTPTLAADTSSRSSSALRRSSEAASNIALGGTPA